MDLTTVLKKIFILSSIINVVTLLSSVYSLQVLDKVISSSNIYTLIWLTVGVLFLHLCFSFLSFIRVKMMYYIGEIVQHSTHKEQVASMFSKDQKFQKAISQYLKFITDQNTGIISLFDAFWSILFILGIFFIHITNGIITVIGMVVIIYIERLFFNMQKLSNVTKINKANQEYISTKNSIEYANASGNISLYIKSIANKLESIKIKSLELGQAKLFLIQRQSQYATNCIVMSLQSILFANSAFLVIQNKITTGSIIATSILFGRATKVISGLMQSVDEYKQFVVNKTIVEEYVSLPSNEKIGNIINNAENLTISVKDVHIKYPEHHSACESFLIRNLTFEFNKQNEKIIAISGNIGSGKSLITKLIAGELREYFAGSVSYNQVNIYKVLEERGQFMSFYNGEISSFNSTIGEYISRFDESIDLSTIVAESEKFSLNGYIKSMKNGYNTKITPQFLLSTPVCILKKLALCASFYKSPKLIVLQNLNSLNFDKNLTHEVKNAIITAKNNKSTVVMETNNKDLLDISDIVHVIEAGMIKQSGTINNLLTNGNG